MNTNLKKLAKKVPVSQTLVVILSVIALVCGLIALVGSAGTNSDELAKLYTPESKEGERAYIEVQYSSDAFAEFDAEAADKLYFMLDEEYNPYIVCVSDSDIAAYAKHQAYTFGETTEIPEVIRTYGTLMPIEDDLVELAVEGFNWFWGENVVTEENFEEIFGSYYLDTAITDVSGTSPMMILVMIVSVVLLVIMTKRNGKLKKKSRETLSELESRGETERINAELQDMRTSYFKQIGVYLTENYLISYSQGLSVSDLRSIVGIYGVVTEKNYQLVVRDGALTEKTVVETKNKVNKQWDELTDLVAAVSDRVPGLEYGVNGEKIDGTVDVTQLQQFFVARKTASALEVQHDMANPDGTIVTPNYAFGIIGAFVGALVGGIAWFLVGCVGYIAGIVGYLIIYLSAMGFKKGAKVLTKGGAVIAIIFSVVMIFVANYALYAWQFTQAYEGRFTFMECLGQLGGWMKSDSEVMGGFVKDIAIGYAFTALAGFSTVKSMFGNKKKKEK
ncbi:MAG: hypothetical protein IJZ85_07860 [Lachnospiraceae bacterium]|nr:hypothetical protein [Lachnospiraceae bacterium]